MSARPTDDELADQLWLNSGNGTLVALLAELQARRAADLTADDVEALRSIVEDVNEWGCVCVSDVALSVVRRIIASGGGK